MSNPDNEDLANLPTAPCDAPTDPVTDPGPSGPGRDGGKRRPRSRSRGKEAAALLGVCAVAGAGAFSVTQAVSGSPAQARTATRAASTVTGFQAGTTASVTGQAEALGSALPAKGARRLRRLRQLGGMYGQYTFETKTGSHALAFERGTVTSATSGDVVIRAANGTSWTWELTRTSVVRENGAKQAGSTLAAGQRVFAAGPVRNGSKDARIIVIRRSAAPGSASSASGGIAS